MRSETFLADLKTVLVERGHKGFSVEALTACEDGWGLVLANESASSVQLLQQAIKEPALEGLLTSWTDGDLLVSINGPGYESLVPTLLIREGSLYLVSQSQPRPERSEETGSFSSWFEELIGAPLPISLELERLEGDLWGSPNARGREIVGFPHVLRIESPEPYTLAAFDGYGTNSYALYVTRVSGATRMFLRLPWGGAYMEPERERPRLLESLREANRLFEIAVEKRLSLFLNNNMGAWCFAPQSIERPTGMIDSLWGLAEVRKYVEGVESCR